MNLSKIILISLCLFNVINTYCVPSYEELPNLDRIRGAEDCERRSTSYELQQQGAYRCCYLYYYVDSKNVYSDVYTCCLITEHQYNNIKTTVEDFRRELSAETVSIDCEGFNLSFGFIWLLLLLILF